MANLPCLTYFAKKDALGWPIPGTLQGYNKFEQLPCDSICNLIEIDPTQVQPNGTTICLHPDLLRYFYRVNRKTPQSVKPNSLIAAYEFPTSPTDGCWREWHKYC